MTDLTLDEYHDIDGIPEKKLRHMLQTEAKTMYNTDAIENRSENVVSKSYLPSQHNMEKIGWIFRYWERIKILMNV